MHLGPIAALFTTTGAVGYGTFMFLSYAYPTETQAFKNQTLIKLVTSGIMDISRLSDDLRYILDFDKKMAQVDGTLPEDRKEALLCLISHYIRLLNEKQSSQYLLRFRQAMNSLFDLSIDFHEPIDEQVKIDLQSIVSRDYPQVHAEINIFIEQLVQFINNKDLNPKPNPLLLLGPAGVGKTRLVEEILSVKLNLHVFKVSLANLRSAQLAGDKSANLCNDYNEGIILSAIVKAARSQKRAPVVVFLDDIDAAFTKGGKKVEESEIISWLTANLDPDLEEVVSELFDRYRNAEHNINGIGISSKNIIFIAAANSPHFVLTEGLQRRLRSRIVFPAMTVEKKVEIANDYSAALESAAQKAVQDGTVDNRVKAVKHKAGKNWLNSTEYQTELAKVTLSEAEKAQVEQIARRDRYPGAGTMKDTINKWWAAKCGKVKFDINGYYQTLEANSQDTLVKQPTFTPGFEGAVQRDVNSLSVEELAALMRQKLALEGGEDKIAAINKLLKPQ